MPAQPQRGGEIGRGCVSGARRCPVKAVPWVARRSAEAESSSKIPGENTRLTYYVDEALKDAGYEVKAAANPSAVRVIWQEQVRLLTGNGPQAVDHQAAKLRQLLATSQATKPGVTSAVS